MITEFKSRLDKYLPTGKFNIEDVLNTDAHLKYKVYFIIDMCKLTPYELKTIAINFANIIYPMFEALMSTKEGYELLHSQPEYSPLIEGYSYAYRRKCVYPKYPAKEPIYEHRYDIEITYMCKSADEEYQALLLQYLKDFFKKTK